MAKPDPLPAFNLRAYLEGPVREAADVYVNGQRAGVVWHPPYTIDVSSLLKAGKNELRIVVGNTHQFSSRTLSSRLPPAQRSLWGAVRSTRHGQFAAPAVWTFFDASAEDSPTLFDIAALSTCPKE